MSWFNLGDHNSVDVLARMGLRLVESANASRYHWVVVEIVGTLCVFVTIFISYPKLNLRLYMIIYMMRDDSFLCNKSSFNLNVTLFDTLVKPLLEQDGCLGTNWMKKI